MHIRERMSINVFLSNYGAFVTAELGIPSPGQEFAEFGNPTLFHRNAGFYWLTVDGGASKMPQMVLLRDL
ncbi:UNVERIFIED_CONTAM: hypothetical protein ACS92_05020 [Bacillus cereus]